MSPTARFVLLASVCLVVSVTDPSELTAQDADRDTGTTIEAGVSANDGVTTDRRNAPADQGDPPPPAGVRRSDGELDVVVPGPLFDQVLARGTDGKQRLVLLVTEAGDDHDDTPRRLLTVEGDRLVTLLDDLPEDTRRLYARDVDDDGADELFAIRRGFIDSLGTLAAPTYRPLLELPGLDPGGTPRDGLGTPAPVDAPIVVAGAGRAWVVRIADGTLVASEPLPLPMTASRRRGGLRLVSPPVTVLWREDGSPLLAAGPGSDGRQRLKTVLIDPGAPEDERRSEVFSLLPSAERVEQSWYGLFAGRPRLLVTTTDAERIGIFDDKMLRLFPLLGDRTREGRSPSLKATTEVKRWNDLEPVIADVDRDGNDDLVLLQQADLSGDDVLVEAFLGKGTGRFEPRSRRSEIDDANLLRFVPDLDGDGRHDLLHHRGGTLSFHPGLDHRRRVVDDDPAWSRPLADLARGSGNVRYTRVELVEVDGVRKVLLTRRTDDGHGRLRLVDL